MTGKTFTITFLSSLFSFIHHPWRKRANEHKNLLSQETSLNVINYLNFNQGDKPVIQKLWEEILLFCEIFHQSQIQIFHQTLNITIINKLVILYIKIWRPKDEIILIHISYSTIKVYTDFNINTIVSSKIIHFYGFKFAFLSLNMLILRSQNENFLNGENEKP